MKSMKKYVCTLALVGLLSLGVGCTTAWLSTFDGYLKIAGPILIQVLDIVSLAKGVAPNAQLVAKITSDQAAVNKLADSVSSASAQNVQGFCAQFNLGVQTFAADLTAIEQLGQVNDPAKQQEIATITQLAEQTIAEIEAPLAACQASPNSATAMARLSSAAYKISSPGDVVKRFNAVVDSKHRVHYHGAFARALTFGKLQ